MKTSIQETHWVLRAQCHDREALELLLRSVQPSLRRYLISLVGPLHADDILQEVLILVCRKLPWLRTAGLFRAWTFRIASRVGLRYVKKERRLSSQAADEGAIDDLAAPEAPTDASIDHLLATGGASPASRAVLVLHFQEDLTLAEVAAILELPLGTVKSRLAYGLASMRRELSKKGL